MWDDFVPGRAIFLILSCQLKGFEALFVFLSSDLIVVAIIKIPFSWFRETIMLAGSIVDGNEAEMHTRQAHGAYYLHLNQPKQLHEISFLSFFFSSYWEKCGLFLVFSERVRDTYVGRYVPTIVPLLCV